MNEAATTKLLVSIRDRAEAALALAAGVDLIDVKEPTRGSLGAAAASEVQAIVDLVAGRAPVSAAGGELVDWAATADSQVAMRPIRGLSLAKIGLAQCGSIASWRKLWRRWAESLPAGTEPVAVAYADADRAASPDWRDVLEVAVERHAAFMLLDTFDKKAGTLVDHWSSRQLSELASNARDGGVGLVLAGSLTRESIPHMLEYQPAYIAVRGAACRGEREGRLDSERVAELVSLLRQNCRVGRTK